MRHLKEHVTLAYGGEELAGIQRRLGELEAAEKTARGAVHWADEAAECESRLQAAGTWAEPSHKLNYIPLVPSWLRQCSTLSALGAVLHRRGKLNEAWDEFKKAHKIHEEHESQWVLHSEPGVRYCMLRLDRASTKSEYQKVLGYANKMLDWSNKSGSPHATKLIKGLHYLIKGRALMELGLYEEALAILDKAVQLIQNAHMVQFLCEPLLTRAAVQRHLTNNPGGALNDVNAVLRISGECKMRPYQADGHLLRGHIVLDSTDAKREAQAFEDLIEARRLTGSENDENCYGLRIAELHLLAARIEHFKKHGSQKDVQKWLADAYTSFKEINYWRLLRQWRNYRNGSWQT